MFYDKIGREEREEESENPRGEWVGVMCAVPQARENTMRAFSSSW
jgi:hypothetical protein